MRTHAAERVGVVCAHVLDEHLGAFLVALHRLEADPADGRLGLARLEPVLEVGRTSLVPDARLVG